MLQEAYSALVRPFLEAIQHLSGCFSESPGKSTTESVKILLFVLEAISDLIHVKGSVLSMWALDPPVFKARGPYSAYVYWNFWIP